MLLQFEDKNSFCALATASLNFIFLVTFLNGFAVTGFC